MPRDDGVTVEYAGEVTGVDFVTRVAARVRVQKERLVDRVDLEGEDAVALDVGRRVLRAVRDRWSEGPEEGAGR